MSPRTARSRIAPLTKKPAPRPRRRAARVAMALAAVALVPAGAVATAAAVNGDTTVTVGAPQQLVAGATSPVSAPGIRRIRRNQAIPAPYVLVGRAVTVVPGRGAAGAAVRLTCPAGKALRTLALRGGKISLRITESYVGRPSTIVVMIGRPDGEETGTAYGVCR